MPSSPPSQRRRTIVAPITISSVRQCPHQHGPRAARLGHDCTAKTGPHPQSHTAFAHRWHGPETRMAKLTPRQKLTPVESFLFPSFFLLLFRDLGTTCHISPRFFLWWLESIPRRIIGSPLPAFVAYGSRHHTLCAARCRCALAAGCACAEVQRPFTASFKLFSSLPHPSKGFLKF